MNNNTTKIIVSGWPRGGSTALRSAISGHSQIYCVHEILHHLIESRNPGGVNPTWPTGKGNAPLTSKEAEDILNELHSGVLPNKFYGNYKNQNFIGFHYNINPSNAHDDLVFDWADKIIFIDRVNQYDRWKSFFFATKFDLWHDWNWAKNKDIELDDIYLEEKQFESVAKFVIKWQNFRISSLKKIKDCGKDFIVIDYKDFCKNPTDELKQVQELLGLNLEDISPGCKKFKERTFKNESDLLEYLKSKKLLD